MPYNTNNLGEQRYGDIFVSKTNILNTNLLYILLDQSVNKLSNEDIHLVTNQSNPKNTG